MVTSLLLSLSLAQAAPDALSLQPAPQTPAMIEARLQAAEATLTQRASTISPVKGALLTTGAFLAGGVASGALSLGVEAACSPPSCPGAIAALPVITALPFSAEYLILTRVDDREDRRVLGRNLALAQLASLGTLLAYPYPITNEATAAAITAGLLLAPPVVVGATLHQQAGHDTPAAVAP